MIAKKIALGFGVAIVFPMMIHFGVKTFSPPPQRADYQVEDYNLKYREAGPEEKKALREEKNGLDEQFRIAEEKFQKTTFVFAVPFGLIAIYLGAYLPQRGLGAGLMFGGIFSAVYGYVNNWGALDDGLKFASMVVAFGLLLYLALKKIETRGDT